MGCGASAQGKGNYDPSGPISVNHFKQERVLGEGGFGKVRYVIKKDTLQGYAMKCMDKHRIVEKKQVKMIFKERALLVDLSTPEAGAPACCFFPRKIRLRTQNLKLSDVHLKLLQWLRY